MESCNFSVSLEPHQHSGVRGGAGARGARSLCVLGGPRGCRKPKQPPAEMVQRPECPLHGSPHAREALPVRHRRVREQGTGCTARSRERQTPGDTGSQGPRGLCG